MGLYKGDWILMFSLFGLLFFAVYLSYSYYEDCKARGGHMVKTGESTYLMKSGNVFVPITSDEYECNK